MVTEVVSGLPFAASPMYCQPTQVHSLVPAALGFLFPNHHYSGSPAQILTSHKWGRALTPPLDSQSLWALW